MITNRNLVLNEERFSGKDVKSKYKTLVLVLVALKDYRISKAKIGALYCVFIAYVKYNVFHKQHKGWKGERGYTSVRSL